MKKCCNCGREIDDKATYCSYCGSYQDDQKDGFEYETVYINDESNNYNHLRIREDRNIILYIILDILTFGIYGYWFIYSIAQDVNVMCDDDGDYTPGLFVFIILNIITFGFYSLYWEYKLANRLQFNLEKNGIACYENGLTILLWHLVGLFFCGLGPIIAKSIIIKNTNKLAQTYNRKYVL